jgi:hypothetical protein
MHLLGAPPPTMLSTAACLATCILPSTCTPGTATAYWALACAPWTISQALWVSILDPETGRLRLCRARLSMCVSALLACHVTPPLGVSSLSFWLVPRCWSAPCRPVSGSLHRSSCLVFVRIHRRAASSAASSPLRMQTSRTSCLDCGLPQSARRRCRSAESFLLAGASRGTNSGWAHALLASPTGSLTALASFLDWATSARIPFLSTGLDMVQRGCRPAPASTGPPLRLLLAVLRLAAQVACRRHTGTLILLLMWALPVQNGHQFLSTVLLRRPLSCESGCHLGRLLWR